MVPSRLQRRLDHDNAFAAHADPAGGDHQVGPRWLVLDGRAAPRPGGRGRWPAGRRRQPASRAAAAIMKLLESQIRAGHDRRARLGQLAAGGQHHHSRPGPDQDRPRQAYRRDHRRRRASGRSLVPAVTSTWLGPSRRPPARRTDVAVFGALARMRDPGRRRRPSIPPARSASVPGAAAIAPVMIRMLVPGLQRVRSGVARRDLGRPPEASTGFSARGAERRPRRRTAYPSMAELSKRRQVALPADTSSASTQAVDVAQAAARWRQRADACRGFQARCSSTDRPRSSRAAVLRLASREALSRYLRSQGTISSAEVGAPAGELDQRAQVVAACYLCRNDARETAPPCTPAARRPGSSWPASAARRSAGSPRPGRAGCGAARRTRPLPARSDR